LFVSVYDFAPSRKAIKVNPSAGVDLDGMIWPLAQEMHGMTTNQKDEQIGLLRMLLASDPGDHQPHESYAPNNPKQFTRKDFGWAKAQFAEFVLRLVLGRTPLPVPPKLSSAPLTTAIAPPSKARN
jgi:Metal-independent alpha-mannosidase (GH125)